MTVLVNTICNEILVSCVSVRGINLLKKKKSQKFTSSRTKNCRPNLTLSYGKVESVTGVCCSYLKLDSRVKTISLKTCPPAMAMVSIP